MPPAKPMIGDIELQLVQEIDTEEDQVLTQHGVPGLEGDFLQRLGRRVTRIRLTGVMSGPEAGEALKNLRERFRDEEPVSFVADIATATEVGEVLIEEMGVRELAGKPERFEYTLTLREFIPPPTVETEQPPEPPPEPEPPLPSVETGILVVEVTVEGQPEFDFSKITVTVDGTKEDGTTAARTLTNRTNNVWTEEEMPAGRFMVKAAVTNPESISGSAPAQIQAGQTTQAPVTVRTGAIVATTFVVHFRFDRAFVEPCMREVLRQVAARAAANDQEKLVIVGHTDKTGPPNYNQSLSERRARSVFAFLTFGRDRDASLNEWNALRVRRPGGELPSIKDSWDLRQAQHMLQDLGFYPGNVDGKDGPLTKEAVKAYRCHKGLPAGTTVDDDVWKALIEDYLKQDSLSVDQDRFLTNCPDEILKWLGCGEEDPVKNTGAAFRPSRRTELMFVKTDHLPCKVPQPDTFNLPTAGSVNSNWCLGPGSASSHCCLVSPHLKKGTNDPQPCATDPDGPWCREPAEPGTITVKGSIKRELPDGTLEAVKNQAFVLITPNGEFLAGEAGNGEPIPGRTDKDGNFSFPDKRVGVYTVEVVDEVLVRLAEVTDAPVKGNAVCKALRSDTDALDLVIINAPVVREIRLPVAVHLMRALHPITREVRRCPDPANPGATLPQASARTDAEIQAAFAGANRIWQQARIRFELVDIVREAYAFRTDCQVDQSEFQILLRRCAYADVVNVFFIAELENPGEAGFGLSKEDGVDLSGCAVADRFLLAPLSAPRTIHVLAHELGHFVDLDDAPADDDRVMSTTLTGSHQVLTPDEVSHARTSLAATDDCVPLSLRVTGATRIGGSLSHQFVVIQSPGGVVTIDAEIPDRLLAPGVGSLTMTVNGTPSSSDRQATVSTDASGNNEVLATYVPASGATIITARVAIHVVTFTLGVEGAFPPLIGAPGEFEAILTPDATCTVIAQINPSPFCVPLNLVNWVGGTEVADPLRRVVRSAAVGAITVSATLAGVTRQVLIRFIDPAQPGPFAVGEHEYGPGTEGSFTVPTLTEVLGEESQRDVPDIGATPRTFPSFSVARRALVRYPADTPGVDRPVSSRLPRYPLVILAHGNHRSLYDDAASTRVENFRGLQYLARHLASHGYIAVSVDLDEMNLPTRRDPAILQRAHVVLDHIGVMTRRDVSGPLFQNRVDFSQIGLIGHSRGGETVVAAERVNIDETRGHQIRAIASIAPTDFLGLTQTVAPYLVIYGSADGDVSIGWPFRLYDRTTPFKSMIFVYGAIHNFFSEHPDWRGLVDPRVPGPYTPRPPDSTDPRAISFPNHQNIAMAYCLGLMQQELRNHRGYVRLFKNEGRPPGLGAIELFHQVQDPARFVIDNFEQGVLNRALPLPPQLAARAPNNTLGLAVTRAGLAVPSGFTNDLTEASLQNRDLTFFWHTTTGAMVAWGAAGGNYQTETGDRNVTTFQVLSFRVTQRFGSTHNPHPADATTPGAPKLFSVGLTDTAGVSAFIRGGPALTVPFPFKRGAGLTKSALKTVRVPLTDFKQIDDRLDLRHIAAVRFEFTESPTGEMAVDDIEFSN